MKSNLVKVLQILSAKERCQLGIVSGLQILSGFIDMVGIISVIPFLSVAANPELLQSNRFLGLIQNWTGYSNEYFLVFLGVASIVMLILNQAVRLGSGWYGQFVTHRIWWALCKRMFRYYLNKNYLYHLQHSSTILLERLQVRINAAVAGVIQPIFLIMSSFFSTLFMLGLLVWVEPVLTLILLGIIGAFYLIVYQKIKAKLEFYGRVSPEFSRQSFNLIAEALGAVKEIKIMRNSQNYLDLFDPMAKKYCDSQVKKQLFSEVPGGLVEVVVFGGIMFITLIMISSKELSQVIPLLGLYALSLRRILPAIQNAYQQIAQIRFHQPSFEVIYEDLAAAIHSQEIVKPVKLNIEYNHHNGNIELKELSFSYPDTSKSVLDSISLEIPMGSMIGIAGGSGAGKTTLVDLIIGLFEPDAGSILIGGKSLDETNLAGWQSSIGYVPQTAFIADGTIARNIGFGVPENQVDLKRVKEVALIAQISDFIELELPKQYETFVGERGIRLSGGQRQRLSIARALYHDPDILILDEATSALDGINEAMIMLAIRKLADEKTIIIVAHRLTTLTECDNILFLEDGNLVDQGNYQYLMENNLTFKRMARDERKDT